MKHIVNSLISGLLGFTLGMDSVYAGDPEIAVHIMEDVSGSELQKHGIQSADFEDMETFADTLFATRSPSRLSYDVVDENGLDNTPLRFLITPFDQPLPERPVFKGMTVREKTLALQKFETDSAKFKKDNEEWRSRVIEGARSWLDECVEHRIQVEEDFLIRLKANRNRDFRRSDIIGAVQKANETLAGSKRSFLVINSDLVHKPGPQAVDQSLRALTFADIAGDVVVILVNTSREPDKSPLLQGLLNKILHADSLKQAAEIIAAESEALSSAE